MWRQRSSARSPKCASDWATACKRARWSRSSTAARSPTPRANIWRPPFNLELQSALFQRDKGLFDKKIIRRADVSQGQDDLRRGEAAPRSRAAKTRRARFERGEIAELPNQPVADLRRKDDSRAARRPRDRAARQPRPAGRRRGAGEGALRHLRSLVVEADSRRAGRRSRAPRCAKGNRSSLAAPEGRNVEGKMIFVNAMLTPETRTGHVIARFDNARFPAAAGQCAQRDESRWRGVRRGEDSARGPANDRRRADRLRADARRVRSSARSKTGAGDDESVEIDPVSRRARSSPSPTHSCSRPNSEKPNSKE